MPQLPPDLDLTSVYAKLDRAEEHFKTVDSEIAQWLKSGRYEPFFERGTRGTRIGIAVVRTGPPPDLVRWSIIIGDCINNLRASLDHLAHAFMKVHTAYIPTGEKERVTFVIIDDPTEFAKARRGNLKGFTDRFIHVLEQLQPFNRKHPVVPPLLSIIRDLSNADKHRLLQVAGAGVVDLSGIIIGDDSKGTKVSLINPEPIQHNDVICVFESAEPDPNLAIDSLSVRIEISIWHKLRDGSTNPLEGRSSYNALLLNLIEEVKFVIGAFKQVS
jgi:hypothetical protein